MHACASRNPNLAAARAMARARPTGGWPAARKEGVCLHEVTEFLLRAWRGGKGQAPREGRGPGGLGPVLLVHDRPLPFPGISRPSGPAKPQRTPFPRWRESCGSTCWQSKSDRRLFRAAYEGGLRTKPACMHETRRKARDMPPLAHRSGNAVWPCVGLLSE